MEDYEVFNPKCNILQIEQIKEVQNAYMGPHVGQNSIGEPYGVEERNAHELCTRIIGRKEVNSKESYATNIQRVSLNTQDKLSRERKCLHGEWPKGGCLYDQEVEVCTYINVGIHTVYEQRLKGLKIHSVTKICLMNTVKGVSKIHMVKGVSKILTVKGVSNHTNHVCTHAIGHTLYNREGS